MGFGELTYDKGVDSYCVELDDGLFAQLLILVHPYLLRSKLGGVKKAEQHEEFFDVVLETE